MKVKKSLWAENVEALRKRYDDPLPAGMSLSDILRDIRALLEYIDALHEGIDEYCNLYGAEDLQSEAEYWESREERPNGKWVH